MQYAVVEQLKSHYTRANLKARDVVESPCLVFLHSIMYFSAQILLTVNYESHWTVYVVNYTYEQIDILDSNNSMRKIKWGYHAKIG
jgi:hypothetical protein